MSANSHADKLHALLRRLRTRYGAQIARAEAVSPGAPAPGEADPLLELVNAFLLWECNRQKAELAMKRIASAVVDVNELRVCFPDEIVSILGARYPRVEERAMRLRASLNDIYIREHAVTLSKLRAASKRDAWKYLSTLDGMPQFVAARVLLMALGGHAAPVDERLLARLIAEGVAEPDATIEQAAGILERAIKAGDSVESHQLLLAWAEDGPPPLRSAGADKRGAAKPAPKQRSSTITKAAGGKKTSSRRR